MAKKEEKKAEYEVEIISRTKVITYPKIRQPAHTIEVTYVTPGLAPSTIWIPLREVGDEPPEAYWSQIQARKGPLWEKYKKVEMKKVKEDIERRLRFIPEIYTV